MDSGILTILTAILFSFLYILPGYLLGPLLFKKKIGTFISILPISFALSLILYLPTVLFLYFASGPLFFIPLYGLILIILILAILVIKKRLQLLSFPKPSSDTLLVILLIIILLSATLSFIIKTNPDGDSLYHLGFINKMTESQTVLAKDAFFKTDAVPATYGYNLWYPLVATLPYILSVSTQEIWMILSAVLIALVILSAGTLTEAIFNNSKYGLIGAMGFIGIQSFFFGFFDFQLLPYPDQIARVILLPVLFLFLISYIRRESKSLVFIIPLLSAVVTYIHLFSILAFGIISGLIILLYVFKEKQNLKRILLLIASSLFFSVILLLPKLLSITSFIGGSGELSQLRDDGIWVSNSFFIISPSLHFDFFRWILLILFAVLFTFYLILKNESIPKESLFTLLSLIVAPFIVLLVPFFATYGSKLFTYTYIHRLWYIVPFYLITGFIIYVFEFIILKHKQGIIFSKKNILLCITLLLLLVPFFIPSYYKSYKSKIVSEQTTEVYFNGDVAQTAEMISYINERIQSGSVIMSDQWTSYRIGSKTTSYVLTSLRQHFSPVIPRDERLRQGEFLLSSQNMGNVVSLLMQFNANYWVVNKPYASYKSYFNLEGKLNSYPEIFTPVFENENYVIYSVSADQGHTDNSLLLLLDATKNATNPGDAIHALRLALGLDPSNIQAIKNYEDLRLKYASSLDENYLDVASFSSGTIIEDSSPFFEFPNSLDAIIDNKDFGATDYAAAEDNTLPNWFILNFQVPRTISGYTIQWYAEGESGKNWTVEGYANGKWLQLDKVTGNEPHLHNTVLLPNKISVEKIKFEFTEMNSKKRALIKDIDVR